MVPVLATRPPEVLPWFDLLEQVFRAVPIGVKGAFDYGLKALPTSALVRRMRSTTRLIAASSQRSSTTSA